MGLLLAIAIGLFIWGIMYIIVVMLFKFSNKFFFTVFFVGLVFFPYANEVLGSGTLDSFKGPFVWFYLLGDGLRGFYGILTYLALYLLMGPISVFIVLKAFFVALAVLLP